MKSRRSFLIQGAALIALLSLGSEAFARPRGGRNRRRPRKPIKLGKPSQLPVVKHVGAQSITIGEKHWSVREGADITVNGDKAELSDIRVGMQALVAGRILEHGRTSRDNVYEATRIQASRNVKPKSDNNGNKKKRK